MEDITKMFQTTPDKTSRNKILLFSEPGVGKTYSLLSLASVLQIVSPESRVFALDTDEGLNKAWKEYFPDLSNFYYHLVKTWDELAAYTDALEKAVKPTDFLCLDMIGRLWEMAQAYEVENVYGKTAAEFLLIARQKAIDSARSKQPATLPSVDWNVVKKFHNDDFMDRVVARWDCHVIATTGADPINTQWASPEIISIFGPIGYHPDGEKRNPHRFDTVMFLRLGGSGKRDFKTIKDKAKPLLDWTSFKDNLWTDYHEALQKHGKQYRFFPE
jgi:hypothetical protein